MPYLESINRNNNHSLVLLGHTIVTFFLGFYSVFQPLYFYKVGVPLIWIIGFQLGYWLFSFLVVLPNFYVVTKIGVRLSFLVSWVARIFLLLILASLGYLLETYTLLSVLLGIGVLQRLADGYYWLPFHSVFAIVTDGSREGRSLGYLMALGRIASIISPAIGGFLLASISFGLFFSIICFGFTLGISLFAFVLLPKEANFDFDIKELVKNVFTKKNLPYFTEGLVGMTQEFVWPLLLGLRGVSLVVLGGLFTFTNLLRTVVYVFLGNSIDSHRNWLRFIQGIGMGIMSVSFFVRGIFLNLFLAGFGQAIGGIGQTVYVMPTIANMYLKSSAKKFITPIAHRELVLNLGRISLSLVAFVAVLFYEEVVGLTLTLFIVSFWCGMLGILYSFKRS